MKEKGCKIPFSFVILNKMRVHFICSGIKNDRSMGKMNQKNKKKLFLGIGICIALLAIVGITAGVHISKNNRIARINQEREKWKTEAVVSPVKGS